MLEAIKNAFNSWLEGWKQSIDIMNENGRSTVKMDSGDFFTDLLIIICILGVFCNMAGFKNTGNKMIIGSILTAIIGRVIFNAG